MNINFKSSIDQDKSLRFYRSNDNKKTLFKKPVIIIPPFWSVTITAPFQLTAPSPYNSLGFARALTQATFEYYGENRPVYYRNPGCGSCVEIYLDISMQKFILISAGRTYYKDFSTNLTAVGWLDVVDNTIVNLTASGGTVSILPPS